MSFRNIHKTLVGTFTVVVLATFMLTIFPTPSHAEDPTYMNFMTLYDKTVRGELKTIGNTLMLCDTSDPDCVKGLNQKGGSFNNGKKPNVAVKADSAHPNMMASSSILSFDPRANVEKAYLMWSAHVSQSGSAPDTTIKLKTPQGDYVDVKAQRSNLVDPVEKRSNDYAAVADVTALVKQGGAGEYWAGGLKNVMECPTNCYAGWALYVVLKGDKELYPKTNSVNIFFGHKGVRGRGSATVTTKGFKLPSQEALKHNKDKISAKVSMFALEGDKGYVGDKVTVQRIDKDDNLAGEEKKLSTALSPSQDFFNSVISTDGSHNVTTRTPNYPNNMGVDIKTVDFSKILKPDDTGAKFKLATTGEYYYTVGFATQVGVYRPEFPAQSKSYVNITHPNATKNSVGDILEYSITFKNSGHDSADNFVVTDELDSRFEYIGNSSSISHLDPDGNDISSEWCEQPQTDIPDGDCVIVSEGSQTKTIKARIGKGASDIKGGTIAPGHTYILKYQVEIKQEAAGKTIPNTASYRYTQRLLEKEQNETTGVVNAPVKPMADLQIKKQDKSNPTNRYYAGKTITWTITAINNGPNASTNVIIKDSVPKFLTNVKVIDAKECSVEKDKKKDTYNQLVCRIPKFAKFAKKIIKLQATIPPSTNPRYLSNAATIESSDTTEPNTRHERRNNRSEHRSKILRNADLRIEKSVQPAEVKPGESQTWTVSVTNDGPSDAKQFNISDVLPKGIISPTQLSDTENCSFNQRKLTCQYAALAVNDKKTITFKTKVDPADSGDRKITNTAQVASDEDNNSKNNLDSAELTVLPSQANVTLSKVTLPEGESPKEAVAGETVSYKLIAANNGPSRAKGLVLTDTLPKGLTFKSATTSNGKSCTSNGQTISCPLGGLSVKGTITVIVVADVASSAQGQLTNTATLSGDNVAEDKTATSNVNIVTKTDLQIKKTAANPAEAVTAGTETSYTLKVTNKGPSDAQNVTVTDELPKSLTYVSSSIENQSKACSHENQNVTCVIPSLAAGKSATVTLNVRLKPGASAEEVSNTAHVSSDTPESEDDLEDNKSTAKFSTEKQADIEITKTVAGNEKSVTSGKTITWNVEVNNNGPSQAKSVSMRDTISKDIVFKTVNVTVDDKTVTCNKDAKTRVVSCTKPLLNVGKKYQVTISGTVDPNTDSKQLINTASADAEEPNDDPTTPNTSKTSTTINQNADLGVVKELKPRAGTTKERLVAGEKATWTLTVTNNGTSRAKEAVVQDRLPADLTFVSATPAKYKCNIPEGGETVTCELGDLKPGGKATVTLVTLVAADVESGAKIENTAVTSSETPDDNEKNDRSDVEESVSVKEKLKLKKTVSPDPLISGSEGTYTIKVMNDGPSWARDVKVNDTLPAGLEFVANGSTINSSGKQCRVSGRTVECPFDHVAVGKEHAETISIPVMVKTKGSTVENTATATSTLTTSDNPATSTITTKVIRSADLEARKWPGEEYVVAGKRMNWNLAAYNNGPSTAKNVVLKDKLPANMQYVDEVEGCQYDKKTREVTCQVDTINAEEEAVKTIPVLVDKSTAEGEIKNTVTVNGKTDHDPENDTATGKVTVQRYSELSLQKHSVDPLLYAGKDAQWVVTASNSGPSDAKEVTVTDTLPQGVTAKSAKTKGGTCAIKQQQVICHYDTLEAPAKLMPDAKKSVDIIIDTHIASDYSKNTVENAASVSSESPYNSGEDGTPITVRTNVPVRHDADILLQKQAQPETLTPGENVQYTLVATNKGSAQGKDVVITDRLPKGLTKVQATSKDATCTVSKPIEETESKTASSGKVKCVSNKVLAVGDAISVTIKAHLDPSLVGELENTADVKSASDPNPNNNVPSTTNTLVPRADVSIEKTLDGKVVPGKPVSWVVTVKNDGPSDAVDVNVTDMVAKEVTNVVATAQGGKKCKVVSNKLSCELNTLPAGKAIKITVKGDLDENYQGKLANQAVVTTNTDDPKLDNNSSTVTSQADEQADVYVEKALLGPVIAGEKVSWKITAGNRGASLARNLLISDNVPETVSNLTVQADNSVACKKDGNAISCSVEQLSSGKTVEVKISGTLDAKAVGTLTNTAKAQSATPDPELDNNSATSTSKIETKADLSITKQLKTTKPVAGEPVQWTLKVANEGSSSARKIVVTDNLPEGVSEVKAKSNNATCAIEGTKLTCEVDTLDAKKSVEITIDAMLDAAFSGKLENNAAVSSDTPDPDLSNNESGVTSDSANLAQLAITKTPIGEAVSGQKIAWDINVSNAGPSVAKNVVVTDKVPQAVSAINAGEKNQCNVAKENFVTCKIGALKPGANTTIRIEGVLDAGFSGTLTNTADATAEGAKKVSATASSPTKQRSDVSIKKKMTGKAVPGEDTQWELTVANTGPSTAKDLVVTDELPEGISEISATGSDGQKCQVDGRKVICRKDTLAVDATVTVIVKGHIAQDYEGSVDNQATVSTTTFDPDLSNNTANASSDSTPGVDIKVEKTADKKQVNNDQVVKWTLKVTNNGTSVAREVSVEDTLAKTLKVAGKILTPKGTSCVKDGQKLVCKISTLEAKKTVEITVPTKAHADATQDVTNTVLALVPSADDANLSDNTASAKVKVVVPTKPAPPGKPAPDAGKTGGGKTPNPAGGSPSDPGTVPEHKKPYIALARTGTDGHVAAIALIVSIVGGSMIGWRRKAKQSV